MVAAQDAIRGITHKLLAMAIEECRKEETKKHIRDGLVDPLIKTLHTQLMPYFLMTMVIVVALLLMSMMTLVLSAMFYFRRANFR
jgi:hypothetical protein